jgi:hypothetical protein
MAPATFGLKEKRWVNKRLQSSAARTTKAYSRMRKKLSGIIGLIVVSSFLTGCNSTQRNSVQGYSIRSYQGPLPMADYRYVNPEAYGIPANPR